MGEGACLIPPARDVADEIAKAPPRLRRDFVRVQDPRRSKTEWNPFSAGKHVKFPDGFIAKAPLGHIDDALTGQKIGKASCRERVCRYVSILVVAVALKQKKN